jgi:WNK lysine deficient protein kinase
MKSGISADYYLPFSSNGSAAMEGGREGEAMSSFLDSCSMMSTLYSLSISDHDYPQGLKTELNLIESQFNQSLQDLLKLKEDAIENAKRKWITKKQKGVIIP